MGGRRKDFRSLIYKSAENIYIFFFWNTGDVQEHKYPFTDWVLQAEGAGKTLCTHYPQQRETALYFCLKNLADLWEISGS